MKVVNETYDGKKEDTKDESNFTIRYPQLLSEEMLAVDSLQLKVVNETDVGEKEDTKDEIKFTI